jgi:Do/DeqQ family serine protease
MPKKIDIIANEQFKARNTNNDDIYLTGKFKRLFTSSSPTDFIEAASKSRTSVVSIMTIQRNTAADRTERYGNASGSGVVISAEGHIVTNNHVIEDATQILVTLDDKRELIAEIVGTDPSTDIALLKINANNLDHLIFGNSDSLRIGEWVLAIGNPFRLTSSVTAGIVSAKARNINILEKRGIESFIQTDAAINPGNSGGALINTNGELVGINTAIMTYSGKYEGFSFAVPSNLVSKVVYDLKEYGAVQRGWMGVTIFDVDETRAKELNLDFIGGVLLDAIEKNSAAKDAGLLRGDVVISINKVATRSMPEFLEQIARYRPGDLIDVEYVRAGQTKTLGVTLRNQLNTTDYIAVRKDKILTELGLEVRDMDSTEKNRLNTEGIVVVSIYKGSTIDATNMDPGYIITTINDEKINSVNQLVQKLKESESKVILNGFYEYYPGEFPYTFSIN